MRAEAVVRWRSENADRGLVAKIEGQRTILALRFRELNDTGGRSTPKCRVVEAGFPNHVAAVMRRCIAVPVRLIQRCPAMQKCQLRNHVLHIKTQARSRKTTAI